MMIEEGEGVGENDEGEEEGLEVRKKKSSGSSALMNSLGEHFKSKLSTKKSKTNSEFKRHLLFKLGSSSAHFLVVAIIFDLSFFKPALHQLGSICSFFQIFIDVQHSTFANFNFLVLFLDHILLETTQFT